MVPVTKEPLKLIKFDGSPLQIVVSAGWVTVGVGLTVMVNVFKIPSQVRPPFEYLGVTETVATTGAALVFTPLNPAIFPAPTAARPILVLSFIQVYVPVPEKLIAVIGLLLQTTWLEIVLTVGVGFIEIVKVFTVP